MGRLHTLRGTEQDTHGRGRYVVAYARRKALVEVWENPWKNECAHSEISELLLWEGIFARCASAASFLLPPLGLCAKLKSVVATSWLVLGFKLILKVNSNFLLKLTMKQHLYSY